MNPTDVPWVGPLRLNVRHDTMEGVKEALPLVTHLVATVNKFQIILSKTKKLYLSEMIFSFG